MAINTSTFESTLQTKLNAVSDAKEMLLLGKALESTVGSIAVSDINTAGATKVAEINTVASNTFKTVGGSSILGSGDIATLPSGGTAGQVVKKDASNNAVWGTDTSGKIAQIVNKLITSKSSVTISSSDTYVTATSGECKLAITPQQTGSWLKIEGRLFGEITIGGSWNVVFNFNEVGVGRVHNTGNLRDGLAMLTQTYDGRDDGSTPEIIPHVSTIVKTGNVAGVSREFGLVLCHEPGGSDTWYMNRTIGASTGSGGNEAGISEITITEILV